MKLALTTAALVLAVTSALAQTTSMKKEEVPAAVRAAGVAVARGGNIDSVQLGLERAMAIYEFKVHHA